MRTTSKMNGSRLFGSLLVALGTASAAFAQGDLPSGTIIGSGSGPFNYSLAFSDAVGATNPIGSVWYGWIPGHFFLPSTPSSASAPVGWTATISGNSIQFTANAPANYIQPGQTLSGFGYLATFSPSQLASAPNSGESDAYTAGLFSDSGVIFTVYIAATTNVLVGPGGNFIYSPAVVDIHVGDQVIWTWQSVPHSATSGTNGTASGMWDSGDQLSLPHSFTNTFNSAGSFTYFCVEDFASGMTGAVNVAAAPIVLSAPQFLPPADFRFNYTANTGLKYIVQRSANLSSSNWTTLGTNQASGSPVIFDDTNATGNPAFYRVGLLPNP
jgi:plastocyanin